MAMPAIERARHALEEARVDQEFWEKNYQRFLELYPDKFVVVYDNEVVAADSDLQQILQLMEAKGLDRHRVRVRFITANPQFLLL